MKTIFLFLISALMFSTAHAAKTKTFNDTLRIVPWNELSIDKIQQFTHSKNSDFTVQLKEGTMVPLQFVTKNRTLSALIDPNLMIRVDKTCYLRIVDKKCYMSEDLVQWQTAGKFMEGETTFRFAPSTNKPGLVLEQEIVPYAESEEED